MVEGWQREEPESPCVGVCVINRACGYCIGCHRTGAEISRWGKMSARERRAVRAQLPARAAALLPKRRGGRKGRQGHAGSAGSAGAAGGAGKESRE